MTEGYIKNKKTGAIIPARAGLAGKFTMSVFLGGSDWGTIFTLEEWDFIEGEPPTAPVELSELEQASMLLGKKVLVHRNHGDRNYALIEVTRVEKSLALGVVVHGRVAGSAYDSGFNFSRFTFEEVD